MLTVKASVLVILTVSIMMAANDRASQQFKQLTDTVIGLMSKQ